MERPQRQSPERWHPETIAHIRNTALFSYDISQYFNIRYNKLLHAGMIFVPKMRLIGPSIAHYNSIYGHFRCDKTMHRLRTYYWKHKAKDIKAYCLTGMTLYEEKDDLSKPLGDP